MNFSETINDDASSFSSYEIINLNSIGEQEVEATVNSIASSNENSISHCNPIQRSLSNPTPTLFESSVATVAVPCSPRYPSYSATDSGDSGGDYDQLIKDVSNINYLRVSEGSREREVAHREVLVAEREADIDRRESEFAERNTALHLFIDTLTNDCQRLDSLVNVLAEKNATGARTVVERDVIIANQTAVIAQQHEGLRRCAEAIAALTEANAAAKNAVAVAVVAEAKADVKDVKDAIDTEDKFKVAGMKVKTKAMKLKGCYNAIMSKDYVKFKSLTGNNYSAKALIKGVLKQTVRDDVVALLSKIGIVNAFDIHMRKPLLNTLAMQNICVYDILIKAGAGVEVVDHNNNTPLLLALGSNYVDVVDMLIKAGANVNAQNNHGNTPLLLASQNGYANIVELLIKTGSDVHAQNRNSKTSLLLASENGYTDVVNILVKSNALVNAQNKYNDTPLLLASTNGHTDVVDLLIKLGADVNTRDKNLN